MNLLFQEAPEEAFKLYSDILDLLNRYGSVDILDIVCLISHFPAPRNWIYARSHGYDRFDVANFTVRPTDDGKKWGVYL